MMLAELAAYVAAILIFIGALFSLTAAIGILRLPDLYTRMHAASKAGTLGSGLMFVGLAVFSFDGPVALRALVGFVFVLLTAPVSAHLLARAAYSAGYAPHKMTKVDELAEKTYQNK